jgi:hypothetical protein
MIKKLLTTLSILIISVICANSQVTIGSLIEPAKGALLDLKEHEPDQDNATANKGLLLPRVELEHINEFTLITNPTTEQKANHTGLLVYNLTVDESKSLERGTYQWDGNKWKRINRISPTEGANIKKMIYTGSGGDREITITLGIFQFNMVTKGNNPRPQIKFADNIPNRTVHYQVNTYGTVNDNKYNFTTASLDLTSAKWEPFTGIPNGISSEIRAEVTVADLENDHLYLIQYLVLSNGTNHTYVIVARQY